MALTIESKHHLHTQLELIMDKEAATTMMEAIPPFDWSEVATKKDLQILKTELNATISNFAVSIRKDMADQTGRYIGWMIGLYAATVAAVTAIIQFAK